MIVAKTKVHEYTITIELWRAVPPSKSGMTPAGGGIAPTSCDILMV